jgi:hypothetical protein
MKVTKVLQKENIAIYKRQRNGEKGVSLYFAYNVDKDEAVDVEFKTIIQARKFINSL